MLATLRHETHHVGDLIFTGMERAFLTAGVVVLTLLALVVLYLGIFLMR